MARVYISSTSRDLEEYRESACASLRRLGHDVVAMEDYTARSGRPLPECLRDVASCDVYVGLFAWRVGFVPAGEKKGITELELEEAERDGKAVLVFILAEDQPWPPTQIDEDKRAIVALRERLQRDHLVDWFRTPDGLATCVATAVTRALERGGEPAERPLPPERRHFLCECIRKYLSELSLQSRVYGAAGLMLLALGALGFVSGMAFEAEKAAIVGTSSLVFFAASVFPFTILRSTRNKKGLWEVCVMDLESSQPSPESVRFAQQLLARLAV